ncbi:MAG: SurA N-terminal domain-containing protein, partial [Candidatus Aquicultor sp.]
MKFYKYGLALVLILAVAIAVVGCSKEPLAGEVNGKNISVADVDERLAQMTAQQPDAFTGAQGEQLKQQFRANVLDQLVDMELMLQEADKMGIKVTDKAIDAKVKEM